MARAAIACVLSGTQARASNEHIIQFVAEDCSGTWSAACCPLSSTRQTGRQPAFPFAKSSKRLRRQCFCKKILGPKLLFVLVAKLRTGMLSHPNSIVYSDLAQVGVENLDVSSKHFLLTGYNAKSIVIKALSQKD